MSYKIVPLPLPEMRVYFRICREAFIPGILSVLYPTGYTDEAIEHANASTERRIANFPGRHNFFKITDEDLPDSDPFDKVVGISQWIIFPQRTEQELATEKELNEKVDAELGEAPGMSEQAREAFGKAIKEAKDKFVADKAYMCLAVLATRPDYQRRGVGSVSMAWGTKKADELNLPTWLEGSPSGVPLYKKWGFEVVDQLDWDARDHGFHEPLTHLCMLRPALTERQPIPQS